MLKFIKKLILLLGIPTVSFCGTNTDTPVVLAPLIFLTSPINVPQLVGVIPTQEYPTSGTGLSDLGGYVNPNAPQFIIKYFVTNTEQQFIGYNLSITSQTPTLIETQAGTAGSVYTENGIQPSFPHLATENSTAKENMKRRRIAWRVPPPGIVYFQKCEMYNFTLRAVLSNVPQTSNPSAAVSACAGIDPSKCPVGSSCNPSSCTDTQCSLTIRATCPVGTLCNPCTILDSGGVAKAGCECPDGVSPNLYASPIVSCNR
ncbi:MAG TPA: hypothetical protein PK079_18915 [Leptospiraceae bacterium]|nr:hypothetical protein [Leptospiraceae bacterium]HMW07261.1 hypothetical protein [Leptospiraceae bacterium]HMX34214.1 hypothetical protein [Leptospiraceae bacterium]HMY32921.1 hypothetical protein [Leptospiraceae bacterium]HMZ66066.1 hypothetical protein [Leptospiraceae bacterium]